MQITIVDVGNQGLDPVDPNLRDEAHAHFQEIVRIGTDMDTLRGQLRIHVSWFGQDPARLKALGYESMDEFLAQPEITTAFWGRAITTRTDRFRLRRLVMLQCLFGPDEDVDVMTALPKSITSTPMLSLIEEQARQLPAPTDPNRAKKVNEFRDTIIAIGSRTYRENVAVAEKTLHQEFTYDAKSGIVTFTNGHGPVPALKLNPKAGQVAAVVLNRAVPVTIDGLTMDSDAMTAWVNDQAVLVGTLLTNDQRALDALADITRATRS